MANLDNFDRPWGVGPVSRCVVPGAEVRQVNSGSEYKSPVEKVGGGAQGLWIGWFTYETHAHRQVKDCL